MLQGASSKYRRARFKGTLHVDATLAVLAHLECRSNPSSLRDEFEVSSGLSFRHRWRGCHELKSRERSAGVLQSFHCRNGKAYLFNTVVNIETGMRHVDLLLFAYALLSWDGVSSITSAHDFDGIHVCRPYDRASRRIGLWLPDYTLLQIYIAIGVHKL